MYDDVNYNPDTYTMELDDVWLNSYMRSIRNA